MNIIDSLDLNERKYRGWGSMQNDTVRVNQMHIEYGHPTKKKVGSTVGVGRSILG